MGEFKTNMEQKESTNLVLFLIGFIVCGVFLSYGTSKAVARSIDDPFKMSIDVVAVLPKKTRIRKLQVEKRSNFLHNRFRKVYVHPLVKHHIVFKTNRTRNKSVSEIKKGFEV